MLKLCFIVSFALANQTCFENETCCCLAECQQASKKSFLVPIVIDQPALPICTVFRRDVSERKIEDTSSDAIKPDILGEMTVSIWQDGLVIWTKKTAQGEVVYFEGHIPSEKVQEFLREIDDHGFFSKYKNALICGAHASPLDGIVIYDGLRYSAIYFDEESVEMTIWDSWIRTKGIKASILDSPNDLQQLRQEFFTYLSELSEEKKAKIVDENFPTKWSEFRKDWLTIKRLAIDLIPKEGKTIKKMKLQANWEELREEN